MSDCSDEKWPKITHITGRVDRALGFRKVKISDARNTWTIRIKKEGESIVFKIIGFHNYLFTINKDGDVSCKKEKIERVSDSGEVPIIDGRVNIYCDFGFRKGVRIGNLSRYIDMAWVEEWES